MSRNPGHDGDKASRDNDGYDRLGERTDNYLGRQAGRLADNPKRTVGGWFLKLIGFILVVGLIFAVIGFAADWFNAGKDIVSPANVSEQYRAIIEDYESLEATAINACAAEGSKKEDSDPTLLEDPAFAYKAQYQRVKVDYNRRQKNAFEGRHVGPKGYPRNAPSLEEMQAEVCP